MPTRRCRGSGAPASCRTADLPDLRTTITELTTGLGTLGFGCIADVLAARPPAMVSVSPELWRRLEEAHRGGGFQREFADAWRNGEAFRQAQDGLRARPPLLIEWKGGHRAAGDEAAPVDLRIDHVFLVSCKYRSHILHNASPWQLFDRLLATGRAGAGGDWFASVAGAEFTRLYGAVRDELATEAPDLPALPEGLTVEGRRRLGRLLAAGWPASALPLVGELSDAVARASAERWRGALADRGRQEAMLWRLLRIGSAPYFVLGSTPAGPIRLRVATPWDWRQRHRLRRFAVAPQPGGQARVGWEATVSDLRSGEESVVVGHVEVRWSHGRFAQPPEAKVYLDTPHHRVPGYHPLQ